jgi:hypothetical protein
MDEMGRLITKARFWFFLSLTIPTKGSMVHNHDQRDEEPDAGDNHGPFLAPLKDRHCNEAEDVRKDYWQPMPGLLLAVPTISRLSLIQNDMAFTQLLQRRHPSSEKPVE